MKRYWHITQGTSRAKVLAPDYFAALERGRQIGFTNPDTVRLYETVEEMKAQYEALIERFGNDEGRD